MRPLLLKLNYLSKTASHLKTKTNGSGKDVACVHVSIHQFSANSYQTEHPKSINNKPTWQVAKMDF